jgi:SAM-dependent methyltransferase
MNGKLSNNVWNIIACPQCGASLHRSDQNVICSNCQSNYRYTKSGAIDLRLQQQKKYQYDFSLGTPLLPESGFDFGLLREKSNPEVDFSEYDVPERLSRKIISHFPKAKTDNSLVLDIGCGNMVHRDVCEYAGFEYVGLDYESNEAPMLGDAHALPFKDESFEFIVSFTVLEHIRFPFIAMREAYRVLKPDGTVAFMEPFHQDSFYNHTHLGTYNSLQEGGFRIEKICPDDKWSSLVALANLGLFPRMPHFLSRSFVIPIQLMHKIWWRIGNIFSNNATEEIRLRNTTGKFSFIARK